MGILGPNDSGKSTTMKLITGFLWPDTGDVNICNLNLLENPTAAQRLIGYLPEGAPAYSDISVYDYLKFVANIRQIPRDARERIIASVAARTNIIEVLNQLVGSLSKGFKRRVGLAQALLHDPAVLILDEPTDGLDPNQKHEVRTLIREISHQKAIIISTHILEEVAAVCDRTLIIDKGSIVANGTPYELKAKSRYFGAVTVVVPSPNTKEMEVGLQAIEGVTKVERKPLKSDRVELVALSRDGTDILPNISKEVHDRGWLVEQILRKTVDLNDVFRSLTTSGMSHKPVERLPNERIPEQQPAPGLLRDVWAICKNELIHYFTTPVAYVFIIIFLIASGSFTFFLGGFFIQGQANLDTFFQFHPWLYLFLIPAISMRLWSEERRSGFVELLLTIPVTTFATVLGKFLAAWIIIGFSLMLTIPVWIATNYLGSPDNSAITTGYLGSLFVAGGYLSISAFASALARNQVTAFIIAAALCFLFTVSSLALVQDFFSGWASPVVLDSVANLSLLEHFKDVSHGVVDFGNVVFFLSTIALFLFANVVAVERWKKG